MKDYYPEYIVLKQRHERMKSVHDAKIENLIKKLPNYVQRLYNPL
jgi:hypothetical protein